MLLYFEDILLILSIASCAILILFMLKKLHDLIEYCSHVILANAVQRRRTGLRRKSEGKERFMQQETAGEIMSVLVCISASPSNQRVIRSATRFAQGSRRSITALYVDDGKTGEERAAAIRNLELAESLGASGQIVNGRDVLGTIMDYARDNAVTDLFIGYSGPSQGPYLRHLPVYRLVHNLPEVDIHIIPDSITGLKPSGLESGSKEGLYLKDVLILVTVMGLATALSYLFDRSTFSNSNIIMR